jgi:hypothetical protein
MRKCLIIIATFLICAASASAALLPLSAKSHISIAHPTLVKAHLLASPASKTIGVKYTFKCSRASYTGSFTAHSGSTHALHLSSAARQSSECLVTLTGSITGYGSVHESLSALGRLTGQ